MRTTLNIDDELLEAITQRFPPGTPKTVIIEESLRIALAAPRGAVRAVLLPPDVAALVARGLLVPPSHIGVPPQGLSPPLPAGTLQRDLALDREDR